MPRELFALGAFLWGHDERKGTTMVKKSEQEATKATGNGSTRKRVSTPRRKAKTVTYEMIEGRAYEIFESGTHGSEVDHWLLAERELLSA
jgi:hypothetical protein